MTKRIRCDQCQLLRINGVVCHELNCPNAWKDYVRECKECGREFKPKKKNQMCCSNSCNKAFYGFGL